MKKLLLFSASALLLYTLSWIAISSLTFFSSDVGLRFLQIQELVDHRWRTFAIDYPGRMADPEMKFVPYYYAYSVVEGEMYFNISPYFPLLTSFFYAAFGSFGLPIMPVFGSLLTAWATWRLVRLSDLPHASLAFLATLFATPMLFYAIVLWDHSLGTGLATLAVAGVAVGLIEGKRHAFVLAGIAAGLAIGQRPEIYLFAAALGISLLWVSTTFREGALVDQNVGYSLPRRSVWQPTLLFAVSGLFTTGLVWWTQVLWVGHPLGMALAPHLLGYGAPTNILSSSEVPLLTKISNLLLHTEPTAAWESWATAFVLIGGILLFVLLLTKTFHNRILLLLSITFSVIGYLLFAYGVLHSALIGIIPTFTLLPFALLYVGHKRDNAPQCRPIYRLVLSTTVLFLALIMLTWPGYGGLQWGARYLLPIYPLLVYLAWVGYWNVQLPIANVQLSMDNLPPHPPSLKRKGESEDSTTANVQWSMDNLPPYPSSLKRKGGAEDSTTGQPVDPVLPRESSLPVHREGWGGVTAVQWCAIALLVTGLIVQSTSIYRVLVDHPIHSQIRADLLAMPVEIIATNRPFMPSFMTSINNDKAIVYTRTEERFNQLIESLIEGDIQQFGFVLLSGSKLESNRVINGHRIIKRRFPSKYYEMYIYEIEKL